MKLRDALSIPVWDRKWTGSGPEVDQKWNARDLACALRFYKIDFAEKCIFENFTLFNLSDILLTKKATHDPYYFGETDCILHSKQELNFWWLSWCVHYQFFNSSGYLWYRGINCGVDRANNLTLLKAILSYRKVKLHSFLMEESFLALVSKYVVHIPYKLIDKSRFF